MITVLAELAREDWLRLNGLLARALELNPEDHPQWLQALPSGERDLVPLLEAEKTGLLVWSPLAGGILSGKFTRENQKPEGARRSEFDFPIVDKESTWRILDVMAPIAKAHGCSEARISLAWLLAKPVVTSVIIGAKRVDQLRDNLAAVDVKLSADEMRKLDEVSALPPEYPGWMLPFQNANRLADIPRPVPRPAAKG